MKNTSHTTEQHWPSKKDQAASGNGGSSNNGEGKKKRKKKGKAKENAAAAIINTLTLVDVPDVPSTSSESISVSLYAHGENTATEWMIDSGCTSHVTFDKRDFVSYHQFPVPGRAHTAGKDQMIPILGHGTVVLQVEVDGKRRYITLSKVMFIPDAAARFFAPRVPLQLGHQIIMGKDRLTLYQKDTHVPLFHAEYRDHDSLYWLEAKIMTKSNPSADEYIMPTQLTPSKYDLWHRRFGHAGKKAIENLHGNVNGVPDSIPTPAEQSPCDGCEFGKSKRAPFPPSDLRAEHPLDLVHMDLVEYPVLSIDGYKYTMTTLDDASSFGLMWFLKRKSDALTAFKQFVAWAETQSERHLKVARSNRGGEFLGQDFETYCKKKGIERQTSVAQSPQQNGRAERWQQTIQNKAEAMRHHTGLLTGFWKLAVETAVHIYNRQPLRRHAWKTPVTV